MSAIPWGLQSSFGKSNKCDKVIDIDMLRVTGCRVYGLRLVYTVNLPYEYVLHMVLHHARHRQRPTRNICDADGWPCDGSWIRGLTTCDGACHGARHVLVVGRELSRRFQSCLCDRCCQYSQRTTHRGWVAADVCEAPIAIVSSGHRG